MSRSTILTPDLIETLARAREAEAMNAAMNSGREKVGYKPKPNGPISPIKCCSPDLIKFKFVLCDVDIKNINAAAEENGPAPAWR